MAGHALRVTRPSALRPSNTPKASDARDSRPISKSQRFLRKMRTSKQHGQRQSPPIHGRHARPGPAGREDRGIDPKDAALVFKRVGLQSEHKSANRAALTRAASAATILHLH
jgi:hypothetical protein